MAILRHSLAALGAMVLAPLGAAGLAVRPTWREGLRERLGWADWVPAQASAGSDVEAAELLPARRAVAASGGVWLHGASAGEVLAASRLIECLEAEGQRVVASAMTLTGRQLLRERFGHIASALAPIDHPWCVDRALATCRPSVLAFVETELWPCWIAAAERISLPVVVLSARLSDRSFRQYRRLRRLISPSLRRLSAVGARSELDAQRFIELGVPEDRVSVTGDLKLAPPTSRPQLAGELRSALAHVPTLVAGSTHAGEEEMLLAALAHCEAQGLSAALVIAPRHLQRLKSIEARVRASGRPTRRRSALGSEPLTAGEVLLLDSLGELAAVYSAASVAFVGGTLVPVGGHNLLEPLFVGCPVVFGPHSENVREAAALATQSQGAVQVADTQALCLALAELVRSPTRARERGAAGRAVLEQHRGTAERSVALLRPFLSSAVDQAGP